MRLNIGIRTASVQYLYRTVALLIRAFSLPMTARRLREIRVNGESSSVGVMDCEHRRLYLKWAQSAPTILGIGPDAGPFTHSFNLPIDLLYHRSRFFRDLINSTLHEELLIGRPRFVLPPSISPHTVEDFIIWSLSHSPQISSLEPSFEEATNLGVFAQQYHIPALTNQITDSIRAHLASDEWALQASLVDAVYGAAPAGTPLREVVRAALGKLPRLTGDDGGKGSAEREEWKEVILKHSQLGWDFIEAGGEKWTASAYLSGVCRFHDHDDVKGQKKSGALCDGCPYVAEDCFPVVEDSRGLEVQTSGLNHPTDRTGDAPTDIDARIDVFSVPDDPAAATLDTFSAPDEPADLPPESHQSSLERPRVGNSIMIMDATDDTTAARCPVSTDTEAQGGIGGGNQPSTDTAATNRTSEHGDSSVSVGAQADAGLKDTRTANPLDDAVDDTNGTTTSDDLDEPLTPVQEEHVPTPSEPIVRTATGTSEQLTSLAAAPVLTKAVPNAHKTIPEVSLGTAATGNHQSPQASTMAERTLSQDTTSTAAQKETGTVMDESNSVKEETKTSEAVDSEVKLSKSKSNKKKKKRGGSVSVGTS